MPVELEGKELPVFKAKDVFSKKDFQNWYKEHIKEWEFESGMLGRAAKSFYKEHLPDLLFKGIMNESKKQIPGFLKFLTVLEKVGTLANAFGLGSQMGNLGELISTSVEVILPNRSKKKGEVIFSRPILKAFEGDKPGMEAFVSGKLENKGEFVLSPSSLTQPDSPNKINSPTPG